MAALLTSCEQTSTATLARPPSRGSLPARPWGVSQQNLFCSPGGTVIPIARRVLRQVFALSRRRRKELLATISEVVAAYRDAADRLRKGALGVRFPAGTFPPGLPYVPAAADLVRWRINQPHGGIADCSRSGQVKVCPMARKTTRAASPWPRWTRLAKTARPVSSKQ